MNKEKLYPCELKPRSHFRLSKRHKVAACEEAAKRGFPSVGAWINNLVARELLKIETERLQKGSKL